MREVDRRTTEMGIPGLVLMENAGHRIVEFLAEKFSPLSSHRIVILCGKGNNGGDGLVVARQLLTRYSPLTLDVVLLAEPAELKGDAAANYRMFEACGGRADREIKAGMRVASIVVDALLGTGIKGPAAGVMLNAIREINSGFPLAKVVAVDIPSGMPSDSGAPVGEVARADFTVTLTAPKVCHVLPPNCSQVGELRVGAIGSRPELYEADDSITLSILEKRLFRHLFAPRPRGGHKGTFGHVLVVGGFPGRTGAAAMAGIAALRAGAGLVTVSSQGPALASISAHAPELMTESFPPVLENKDVIALGPGMGTQSAAVEVARRAFREWHQPMVVDADGLNALVGSDWLGQGRLRILTPHPGEMSRLTGKRTVEVEADRVGIARALAAERGVTVVLKGQRSLIAFPDGRVWVNPTGTPAMATGGSGDILTGLIAGLVAQFPAEWECAVAAAVYLHGLAGEIGAAQVGEKGLIATDMLRYLPAAMDACANLPDPF